MEGVLLQSLQKESILLARSFWPLVSRTVREYTYVVLSHQIGGNLL